MNCHTGGAARQKPSGGRLAGVRRRAAPSGTRRRWGAGRGSGRVRGGGLGGWSREAQGAAQRRAGDGRTQSGCGSGNEERVGVGRARGAGARGSWGSRQAAQARGRIQAASRCACQANWWRRVLAWCGLDAHRHGAGAGPAVRATVCEWARPRARGSADGEQSWSRCSW
jgi:hypothetical protein